VIHSVANSQDQHAPQATERARAGERRKLRVAGRLTWRDASGALRFVSVVTRDVSDVDAFVECQAPTSIPLYRLVHFQIERAGRDCNELPLVLQQGKVLSAVYRVGPYKSTTGTPQGYALRLLIEPGSAAASSRKRTPLAVAN
jgi:hypothetical protein